MTNIAVILVLTSVAAIKTVNYGRWAGKQGNKRGAIGLYILAVITVIIPLTVYFLSTIG